jgi:MFS transporter, SP family, sugar:H+ symporter
MTTLTLLHRPLMMAGALIQAGALMTMGGLGVPANPSLRAKQGITAMVIIFGAGYQLGWAPLAHVVSAEVPTSRLRDPTYALGSFCNIIIQFAVNFSMPYLLYSPYANLNSKVGFIFGSLAIVAFVFSYFCIPECKGKSLEEIDRLFLDGVPVRKFAKTQANLSALLPDDVDVRKAGMAIGTEEVHGA